MTPQTLRVLIECDTLLAHTVTRYTTARRRLTEVEPGFPAHTPGAGEPGGGKGFTAGSITDRLAIRKHPELDAAQRLNETPFDIYAIVAAFNRAHIQFPAPDITNNPLRNLRLLIWSRLIIRRLLDREIEPRLHQLDQLHRTIVDLHRTTTTWGYTPALAKRDPNPHLLPDDLTGLWCRSCLRIGARSPRHRGDRCRWCYDFEAAEGFTPPTDLLEIHEHRTVYDRDVEPFRRSHRDRNKKRRRKAG